MKIYEYGEENPECILLIHPSGMDHGDMALFYPERMAQELLAL